MSEKKKFEKPPLNIDEKIKLLEERWLIIEDKEGSKHDLLHIWYFRLTWYFKYFQDKDTNIFKNWTTFKEVTDLYSFDRKLRLLTLDAIEKIEVSLKSNINYTLYKDYWAFWYLDKKLFSLDKNETLDIYNDFIKKINEIQKKQKSIFVKEYFSKYEEEFLPSWMLFEELTIWNISTILNILKSEHSKKIALNYNTYYVDLRKWLNLLVQVRNISAHHSRLWNNDYKVRPRIEDVIFKDLFLLEENWSKKEVIPNYFNTCLIINFLLKNINKNLEMHWLENIINLFEKFPWIDISKMWFTDNWKDKF